MKLFNLFQSPDINSGVQEFSATPGGVLLDVRTREEYAQGRIPGSLNLPLHELEGVRQTVPDRAAPIFVYCLSGARSRQAVSVLQRMGYGHVRNIGGINRYRGEVEG